MALVSRQRASYSTAVCPLVTSEWRLAQYVTSARRSKNKMAADRNDVCKSYGARLASEVVVGKLDENMSGSMHGNVLSMAFPHLPTNRDNCWRTTAQIPLVEHLSSLYLHLQLRHSDRYRAFRPNHALYFNHTILLLPLHSALYHLLTPTQQNLNTVIP